QYSAMSEELYHATSVRQVEGAKDVAVEFNSLSKPYNMTGWRVAMAVGNKDLVAAIEQVKENNDSRILTGVQYAGIAALEGPQDIVAKNIAVYQKRRDMVIKT